MEYAIVAVAAISLAVVIAREVLRSRQIKPVRDKQKGQPIRFQAPVAFKRPSAPAGVRGASGLQPHRPKRDDLCGRSRRTAIVVPRSARIQRASSGSRTTHR